MTAIILGVTFAAASIGAGLTLTAATIAAVARVGSGGKRGK